MNFFGTATTFTADAIHQAAISIGCEIATIKAVIDVESRGGFLNDRRPKILYERHIFSRLTNGQFDSIRPDISSDSPGGYRGGKAEYARLEDAMALDIDCALKSASWGAFQIMGFNHDKAGFNSINSFCAAMIDSEDQHLGAFLTFVKASGLNDELRRRDWTGFARGYNGPAFRINRYDTKLAAAYLLHSSPPKAVDERRSLRMGNRGEDVKRLQRTLGITPDGDFGPATKSALVAWQKSNGLSMDGIAGPRTLEALGM